MNILKKIWYYYQKIMDCLTRYVALLSGIILFAMMVLVTVYIVLRKTMGPGNLDAVEISGYMMVFIVFGSLAKTFREGGLLRVELLYDKYPIRIKKIMDVILGIVALIYCSILTKYSWQLMMKSYVNGTRSVSTYRVLLYIPQAILVFGGILLFLTLIEYEIDKIIKLFSKKTSTENGKGEEKE
ncbi:TRAP transporter small permease [Hespellia stercorisuis]|uniref:TRAP-type C4-dicarboxylate transport system, small permease component n=1 Tax=Hespellia stercorisuis DSM 15480 TaxID=1121950 RepID=A0A1M6KAY0_9FIRM|nr:TRAP transporter small permease [Hespellia stercorisuis]SHJ56125.1 TRAP-type C4-dicarboxylate transport system, small permease component [Hespellia stercorisuis DSM 15480]